MQRGGGNRETGVTGEGVIREVGSMGVGETRQCWLRGGGRNMTAVILLMM
jgi:hypothetical protein